MERLRKLFRWVTTPKELGEKLLDTNKVMDGLDVRALDTVGLAVMVSPGLARIDKTTVRVPGPLAKGLIINGAMLSATAAPDDKVNLSAGLAVFGSLPVYIAAEALDPTLPAAGKFAAYNVEVDSSGTVAINKGADADTQNACVFPALTAAKVMVGGFYVEQADPTIAQAEIIYTYRRFARDTQVSFDAADATNARIDLIVLGLDGSIHFVKGTAAATPVAPALPASHIELARVTVDANATTIAQAKISFANREQL